MGAAIEVEPWRRAAAASRSASSASAPPRLRGTEVGGAEVPLAIDELPLVALAACFAEGTTTIRDAAELRRKESDRIATVSRALNALGGEVEPTEDGMVVEGTGGLRGGTIDSHGDHRIAMLGAVAGLASARASRSPAWTPPRSATPASRPTSLAARSARCAPATERPFRVRAERLRCRHGYRDRRPRRGRQVHRRPRRGGRARLHLPRLRGDVPLRGAGGAGGAASTSTTARRSAPWPRALEIGLDGRRVLLGERDVSAAIREPEVTAAASRVSVHPQVREAMVARQRQLIAAGATSPRAATSAPWSAPTRR